MPNTLFPNASPQARERLEQDATIRLFNTYDWSSSPLRDICQWPESLRGAVRTMLGASTPMGMLVGPQGILLYNHAYARFIGRRHPQVFGQPVVEAWPETAEFSRNLLEKGRRGESWVLQGEEFHLDTGPEAAPVWVDMYCSPIVDDDGSSLGTLCLIHDATARVQGARALARSEERMSLALSSSSLIGTWDWNAGSGIVTVDDRCAAMFGIDVALAARGLPFGHYLAAIHPDDAGDVRHGLRLSNANLTEFRGEFRVLTPSGEPRWLVCVGRPYADLGGQIQRFTGVVVDVTIQHDAAEALSESEARFRTLADSMPQMVWSTTPDGRCDYSNARWEEVTGLTPVSMDFKSWADIYHPEDRPRVLNAWAEALGTGKPFEIEYRVALRKGGYRWALGRSIPVRDDNGRIFRWIATSTDIHESRMAAQERELVAQELSHRIKNIFAVLTGIIGLSARNRPEAKEFAAQLRERIYALGEAHDFVRPRSHISAAQSGEGRLSDFLFRLMRPYDEADDGSSRVSFGGDDITIDDAAATPLALLFHELATNAAKYGALSRADGRVEVVGEIIGDHYQLIWREIGGPHVAEPTSLSGFGSRLVGLSVEGQMRGTLRRQWRPEGLEIVVVVPQNALSRSTSLRGADESGS